MERFQPVQQLVRNWPRLIVPAVLCLFAVLAVYIFRYSFPLKTWSEELLIWDLIWLDAWGLFFVLCVLLVWRLHLPWRFKGMLVTGLLAVHGVIAVSLIFDGTLFGINGYWGDQKFRIAMIDKFVHWWLPGDFYYRNLPPFYPPLYYLFLSTYARIFLLEPYQMIKIGTQYIYLLGPFAVYYLWGRVVGPYRAAVVTLVSFLLLSGGKSFAVVAPHSFVGNILFIPWWLLFVEQVRQRGSWKWYLAGGLLGGLIFMTYYYAFFIGALLLLLRVTVFRGWTWLRQHDTWRVWPALTVLALSALFSAPFWVPFLVSVATIGADKALDWHHIESTGIQFNFIGWSVPGILVLGGFYFAVRRMQAPVYRGLALLMFTTVLYYLLGAVAGALGRPLNLIKANEFMVFVSGPPLGLAVAALLRSARHRRQAARALPAVAIALLILFVHQFNVIARQGGVETARKTTVPEWPVDGAMMADRTGSVFLAANEPFFTFHTVFSFVTSNHHYSHPAALYSQRYRLLYLLQRVDDPYLLNLAFRHNRFDRIDYFMPETKDLDHTITMVLDNYPNKYTVKELHYRRRSFDDGRLFVPQEIDNLFYVNQPPMPFDTARYDWSRRSGRDSLVQLARFELVRRQLTPEGQERMDRYLGVDWSRWDVMPMPDELGPFCDSVSLIGAYAMPRGDSLCFVFVLQPHQVYRVNYKAFLHLYREGAGGRFENFDFVPEPRVPAWGKEDIVFLVQVIPADPAFRRVHFGLFEGEERLGPGSWGWLERSR